MIMNNLRNKAGFTMIELVLVILCVSYLAVTAFPEDSGLAPITLDAAARKVKADLRYTQSMATTTGDPHGFLVTGPTTYKIYNVTTGQTITSPYDNMPMTEDLSEDYGESQFQSQNYQVVFDGFGRPSTGGGSSINLEDEDRSVTKQIQISLTSGFVSLE